MNNVSLGVYARIVQSDAYRDNKLGTTAEMIPQLLGPGSEAFDLEYAGPGGDQHERGRPHAHLEQPLPARPHRRLRLAGAHGHRASSASSCVKVRTAADVAELVAAQTAGTVSRYRGWREWEAETFEVRSGELDRSRSRRRGAAFRLAATLRDRPGGAARACGAASSGVLAGGAGRISPSGRHPAAGRRGGRA